MYNLDQHTDMHKHRDQVITAVPNTAPQTFTFTSPTNGSTATYVGANLQIVFTPSQAKDSDGDILTRNIHVAGPTLDTIIYHTGTSGMITIPSSRLQSNSTYTIDGTITDGIVIVPAANTVTFLTPMSIPGPNNFTQPANNATGVLRPVVFTWTTSQNATQYELMIMQGATTVKDTIISGLTATIPGLNAITTYTSKIRGQNTAGSGDWSPIITFQTADVIPGSNNFTQPANNATGVPRPVFFEWTQSQNATHYELLIMQNGSTVKDTTIYGLTATIPGLEAITQYEAKVRGQNTSGNSSWSPIVLFETEDLMPGYTEITKPANNATNVLYPVLFEWTQSQNATHYELLITQNGSTVKDTTIYGLTATIPGLFPNTEYDAKVRGQTTIDGDWSSNTHFKTIDDVGVENPVKKELSVYPNPFTDYINLKTTTENPLTLDIEIYDMSGKLQENLHENLYGLTDTRFDVSRLTPGMYIMNIHAKTNSVSRMFYHIQLIKK